jgi:hypothetical protein
MRWRDLAARRAAGLCLFLVLAGCHGPPPALDPAAVRWTTTAIASLGVTVSHPDAYTPSPQGDSYVPFRYGRFMPLIVRWVDEREGRQSGLWFGSTPVADILLAGIPGREYIYTHYDGPFGARMIAYVIPWRGKYLGVELRANRDLDPVQIQILARFAVDALQR